jgi:hypothetical protein
MQGHRCRENSRNCHEELAHGNSPFFVDVGTEESLYPATLNARESKTADTDVRYELNGRTTSTGGELKERPALIERAEQEDALVSGRKSSLVDGDASSRQAVKQSVSPACFAAGNGLPLARSFCTARRNCRLQ